MIEVQTNNLVGHILIQKLQDIEAFLASELDLTSFDMDLNNLSRMWEAMLAKFKVYFCWCTIDHEPEKRPKFCQVGLPLFLQTPMLDPAQAKWMNVTPQKINNCH